MGKFITGITFRTASSLRPLSATNCLGSRKPPGERYLAPCYSSPSLVIASSCGLCWVSQFKCYEPGRLEWFTYSTWDAMNNMLFKAIPGLLMANSSVVSISQLQKSPTTCEFLLQSSFIKMMKRVYLRTGLEWFSWQIKMNYFASLVSVYYPPLVSPGYGWWFSSLSIWHYYLVKRRYRKKMVLT